MYIRDYLTHLENKSKRPMDVAKNYVLMIVTRNVNRTNNRYRKRSETTQRKITLKIKTLILDTKM